MNTQRATQVLMITCCRYFIAFSSFVALELRITPARALTTTHKLPICSGDNFKKSAFSDSFYASFCIHRGNHRLRLGDKEGAILDYNEAIRIDPRSSLGYMNLGVAKYEMNDYLGALQDLDQSLKLDSSSSDAYYNLALVESAQGHLRRAIEFYSKAVDYNEKNADAYFNRGLLNIKIGMKTCACNDIKRSVVLGSVDGIHWLKSAEGVWCRNPGHSKTHTMP